jgi:hypothetical protein
MKKLCTLAALLVLGGQLAHAAPCAGHSARLIRGDTPGAISFDVYHQLHPVTAGKLALFLRSGGVRRLPDGLTVCEVKDDGVQDPSAVLVRVPAYHMSYWVNADHLQAPD